MEDDLMKADFVLNRSCIVQKVGAFEKKMWSTDMLRDYINFIQRVFEPYVTEEAEMIIQ